MPFCSNCAAEVNENQAVCLKCGVSLKMNINAKSKWIAALLGILLGSFGLHKFYLGRIGWGIAYLLLFWTFIPGILGIIEGIIYITTTDDAFNAKYNI
jgi:TM2 domain-containing membrane protein YozV